MPIPPLFASLLHYLSRLLSDDKADKKILAALTKATQPLTGYQIHRSTKLGFGRLYPCLHRLEKTGKVASKWRWDTSINMRRKLYYLNQNGTR